MLIDCIFINKNQLLRRAAKWYWKLIFFSGISSLPSPHTYPSSFMKLLIFIYAFGNWYCYCTVTGGKSLWNRQVIVLVLLQGGKNLWNRQVSIIRKLSSAISLKFPPWSSVIIIRLLYNLNWLLWKHFGGFFVFYLILKAVR